MNINNQAYFKFIVLVAAIGTALVSAFFSIYGISTLFAGAAISVAIMASMLEISKLVSVSYLYRYWKETKGWLAAYLMVALIVLMVITSGGIFGYLSSAYQKSATAYKSQKDEILIIEKNKGYAQNRIDQAQSRIETLNQIRKSQESRLSEALTNSSTSRNPIVLKQLQDQTAEMIKSTEADIKVEQTKIDAGIKDIQLVDQQVSKLKFNDNNKDIRTFEFVANLFGSTLDDVAKWFIFMLIVVFDPLAIALVLAYNVIVYRKVNDTPLEKSIELPETLYTSNEKPILPLPKVEKKEKSPIHPNPIELIAKGNNKQV